MANVFYDKGIEALMNAGINLASDTIKVALVDTGAYTFSQSHDFYDDVSAGVIGTPQTLGSKTVGSVAARVFDAADASWTGLTGNSVEAYVIYKDTGTPSTSALIAFFDTASGTPGLPLTPNGGNVTLTFSASGIFKLGT